jgi:hypothetical protein
MHSLPLQYCKVTELLSTINHRVSFQLSDPSFFPHFLLPLWITSTRVSVYGQATHHKRGRGVARGHIEAFCWEVWRRNPGMFPIFFGTTPRRSTNCNHSFRLRSLFSDDVMCAADRQLFTIYVNCCSSHYIKENTSRHCSTATSRFEAHQRLLRAVRSCN